MNNPFPDNNSIELHAGLETAFIDSRRQSSLSSECCRDSGAHPIKGFAQANSLMGSAN